MHFCNRFINSSGVGAEDFPYFQKGSVFRPGGERHSLIYNSLDKNGNVLSWYTPHSPIWYQKVSLCLSNRALAGWADVNLTPESFKGGRSSVGMFFHPFSHDCKLGGFGCFETTPNRSKQKGLFGSSPLFMSTLQKWISYNGSDLWCFKPLFTFLIIWCIRSVIILMFSVFIKTKCFCCGWISGKMWVLKEQMFFSQDPSEIQTWTWTWTQLCVHEEQRVNGYFCWIQIRSILSEVTWV